MAKKAVATLRSLDKTYSKIIRMKRSEKTGAYYFEETVVPADKVQEFLAKRLFALTAELQSFSITLGESFFVFV